MNPVVNVVENASGNQKRVYFWNNSIPSPRLWTAGANRGEGKKLAPISFFILLSFLRWFLPPSSFFDLLDIDYTSLLARHPPYIELLPRHTYPHTAPKKKTCSRICDQTAATLGVILEMELNVPGCSYILLNKNELLQKEK